MGDKETFATKDDIGIWFARFLQGALFAAFTGFAVAVNFRLSLIACIGIAVCAYCSISFLVRAEVGS